jgi:hypothetical protein
MTTPKSQLRGLRCSVMRGMWILLLVASACGMRTLSGSVVDDAGAAVSNCSVTLEAGKDFGLRLLRTTDATGRFSFGSIAVAGTCSISFEKAGYVSQRVPCPDSDSALRVALRRSGQADDQQKPLRDQR